MAHPHLVAFLSRTKEILRDGIIGISSPTAVQSRIQPPASDVPSACESIDTSTEKPRANLYPIVQFAFERLDRQEDASRISHQRAYQLLTFNMGLSVFIVAALQLSWDKLEPTITFTVIAIALVAVLLGLKSSLHCLAAIMARHRQDVTPDFTEDIETFLLNEDALHEISARLIREISSSHRHNDAPNAISVEHSVLSLHTSILQIVAAACVLALCLLGAAYSSPIRVSTIIGSISFDLNETRLDSANRRYLRRFATDLQLRDGDLLRIEGHSDSTGRNWLNLHVSESRAKEVGAFLIQLGLNPTTILTVGFGSDPGPATSSIDEGANASRRVDMRVLRR